MRWQIVAPDGQYYILKGYNVALISQRKAYEQHKWRVTPLAWIEFQDIAQV